MSGSAIGDRFRQICRDRSNAIAIETVENSTVTTFEQLEKDCVAVQRALADAGVERGSAVVSVLNNSPLFFSLLAASAEAGVALLPLNDATSAEAVDIIERAGARAFLVDRPLPIPSVAVSELSPGAWLRKRPDRTSIRQYPPSVVLKLTSGSTALPKAAIASEQQLINDGRHVIEAMGILTTDNNFGCLPLSHSYALGNIVMPLLWQGTRVTLRQSFNASHFVRDVTRSGSTVFPGVPFAFERIRALPGLDQLPSTLRLLITAGARIDPSTVRWFHERLKRKIHSFYGSSETGGITYDASDAVSEPLHVGYPMPETTVDLRVVENWSETRRVFVAGSAVVSGYADDLDSSSSFMDGGFLTGDVGYRNADGSLVLTGRVSNFVNVAGRKVEPAEIERRLLELPGIAEAHVLGIESDTRGQEVVAFLVRTDPSLTPLTIRQLCARTLSAYKIPRRFVFVDGLPIDARGKLDRQALHRLAALNCNVSPGSADL